MSGYYRNIIYLWLAALVVCAGMSSCGSKRASSAKTPYRNAKTEHIRISANLPPSVKALMTEADSWIGTRYAYGGMDRSGVDCSGFVHQVYKNALDIKLPRSRNIATPSIAGSFKSAIWFSSPSGVAQR